MWTFNNICSLFFRDKFVSISVIVLAAGKGTRMRSKLPKVLQKLADKPLLAHVIDTAKRIEADKTIVVYGHGGELVKNTFTEEDISWVEQAEQLGTGHAVQVALSALPRTGQSIILYGDVPLIQPKTLRKLLSSNKNDDRQSMSMITLQVENPFGLGRIIRDDAGKILSIVEEKDANEYQKHIKEVNTGIYCVDNTLLHEMLPKLSNDNAQGEYYLTDIVKLAAEKGAAIETIAPNLPYETDGVNNRQQLAALERKWQKHLIQQLQVEGVQFADPERVDIRGNVSVGQDVFIDANVILSGDCVLGDDVTISAGCVITNSQIGTGTVIKPYCVIDQSQIGEYANIGPFAHLRPQTTLGNDTKIGNFVETKKSIIGDGSKVNHLSYIGDALLGKNCNIGAGTITCNYDGANKHQTIIEDNVFIGTNNALVAPITVGKNATTGAGSVITKDVDANQLAVARGKQRNIDDYERPAKK